MRALRSSKPTADEKAAGPALGGPAIIDPPTSAITFLRANPAQASAFDMKYGPGASKRYLGK